MNVAMVNVNDDKECIESDNNGFGERKKKVDAKIQANTCPKIEKTNIGLD